MNRSVRHRMYTQSSKRLKRRLIVVSMVVCAGIFGVLYAFREARDSNGRDREGKIVVHAATRLLAVGGRELDENEEIPESTGEALGCPNHPIGLGMMILFTAGVLYCFLGLAIVCDEFFQSSLETISEVLGLTPDVAGATFLAAGSSAPELFTSLADAFGDANSTGTGTIVGSAMFNILVIVALSAAVAGRNGSSIHIDWRPVCRDVIFYSYSIMILALAFLDEEVQWWEGLIMALSYVVYIVFMKYNTQILSHCQPPKIAIIDEHQASDQDLVAAIVAVSAAKRPSHSQIDRQVSTKVIPFPQGNKADTDSAKAVETAEAFGATSSPRKSCTLGVRHRVERKLSCRSMSVDTGADGEQVASTTLEDKPLVLADQNKQTSDEENGGAQEGQAAGAGTAEGGGGGVFLADGLLTKDGETAREVDGGEEEDVSRFAWPENLPDQVLFVVGFPLLVILSLTIPDCANPKWRKFYVLTFIMSLVWIGVFTHFMVDWVTGVGCFFNVSAVFMGLVVLAVGTSVPDALGSMIAARSGEANMAIANAVGSNVFDVLIGLGFPWFLRGLIFSEPMPVERQDIEFNVIVLFCTALLFVAVLAVNNWTMNTKMGLFLFTLYITYVAVVIIRELL